MKLPTVTRQGHWHPDGIRAVMRRRGVRAWRIEFEQKRPDVWSGGYTIGDHGIAGLWNGNYHITVGSREGSMLFREGEDGTAMTEIDIPLPWPGFSREWRVYTDQEKWSVVVIALAERSFLTSPGRVVRMLWSDYKHWLKGRRRT
jgi:hypothetical protein